MSVDESGTFPHFVLEDTFAGKEVEARPHKDTSNIGVGMQVTAKEEYKMQDIAEEQREEGGGDACNKKTSKGQKRRERKKFGFPCKMDN
eukprot:CAMPEP_0198564002 /NCGR_PEP_ID=MMETSP1462-20131121/99603_1 /TAXON_ID=1333877 /ORGANISM="Brandtodinium nutriculum, Strain RCC3387" /LENGTH=88 /DNA_ID=CAMNT_0044294965 /DNA_START=146 /DNA_END=409 /DNA_ORIENTATION=-